MLYALRAFIADSRDPRPTVENIRRTLKIYPYVPGSFGFFEKINENAPS
jgi:hypothetical protein